MIREKYNRTTNGKTPKFRPKHIKEKETYFVVGRAESDPLEGKISYESPLGTALVGHAKGDTVDVLAPGGVFSVKILKIG